MKIKKGQIWMCDGEITGQFLFQIEKCHSNGFMQGFILDFKDLEISHEMMDAQCKYKDGPQYMAKNKTYRDLLGMEGKAEPLLIDLVEDI